MDSYLPSEKVINPLHATFKVIGLLGRPRNDTNLQMHKNLFQWLLERGYHVLVEEELGIALKLSENHIATIDHIGRQVQLA
ncbi:MAG TPA: NAD(+) kinase, partial [Pasteurellaceae bacterium]|nr:NAD(+) kinase [Pasteurellaceae bacterium]